ncbi:hypothetical protein [Streptomyces sulphureus]|uniref:hypothetical protein n=1 Tax=Streptomyces sulphureus TaxID=47758 RepID=UPI00036D88C4|nr:hypothetical protein [Streptomyces sulphureus]
MSDTDTDPSDDAEHIYRTVAAAPMPRPRRGERGVMIVSRLATVDSWPIVSYLPHRAVAVTVATDRGPLEIIGLYVPSRDAGPKKTVRKTQFLEECRERIPEGRGGPRLVIGDYNVLEANHTRRTGSSSRSSTASTGRARRPGTATHSVPCIPMPSNTPGSAAPGTATGTTTRTCPRPWPPS